MIYDELQTALTSSSDGVIEQTRTFPIATLSENSISDTFGEQE